MYIYLSALFPQITFLSNRINLGKFTLKSIMPKHMKKNVYILLTVDRIFDGQYFLQIVKFKELHSFYKACIYF